MKNKPILTSILILFVVLPSAIWADGQITLPFRLVFNHIVIDMELNGHKLSAILDSGMPFEGLLLTGEGDTHRFGLNYTDKIPVGGAGGGAVESDIAMGATTKVGNIIFENQMVIAMPPKEDKRLHNEAVIGMSVFGNYVVSLDFVNQQLILYSPDSFTPGTDYAEIPLELKNGFPFATYSITQEDGTEVSLTTTVDLGASMALVLYPAPQSPVFTPEKKIAFRIGRGASKDVEGHFARIKSLKIGPYEFSNVLAAYDDGPLEGPAQMSPQGNLGAGIMSRFDLVMDYNRKRMLLKPNDRYSAPFNFNMVGLQVIMMSDGNFLIQRVVPGSPAENEGLMVDDTIVKINGQPAESCSYSAFRNLMMEEEGKTLTLVIRRDNKESEFVLTLERLI